MDLLNQDAILSSGEGQPASNETPNEKEIQDTIDELNKELKSDESGVDENPCDDAVGEKKCEKPQGDIFDSVPPSAPQPPKTTVTEIKKTKTGTAKTLLIVAAMILSGVVGGFVGAGYAVKSADVPRQTDKIEQNVVYNATYTDISQARALASQSVVTVKVTRQVNAQTWFQNYSYTQTGSGSGVIISEDGYILTCNHVVADTDTVTVVIGEKEYEAEIIGADELTDIALIKITTDDKLVPASLGDSDSLLPGNGVMTIGNPLGLLANSVSFGVVSAINRDVKVENSQMTLIQTDASVSPGNSGGGLFDIAGNLIGIVNAKYADEDVEGIGFAIPINKAIEIASELKTSGYVANRATLGVTVRQQNNHIYVYSVVENSRAAEAGLKKGDRIVAVDNIELSSSSDLTNYIAKCSPGQEIKLLIVRDGRTYEVPATLKSAESTYSDKNKA